jgi:hypothetical protein
LEEEYVEKWLRLKLKITTSKNHYDHAELARERLRRLIENDIGRSIVSGKDFKPH